MAAEYNREMIDKKLHKVAIQLYRVIGNYEMAEKNFVFLSPKEVMKQKADKACCIQAFRELVAVLLNKKPSDIDMDQVKICTETREFLDVMEIALP